MCLIFLVVSSILTAGGLDPIVSIETMGANFVMKTCPCYEISLKKSWDKMPGINYYVNRQKGKNQNFSSQTTKLAEYENQQSMLENEEMSEQTEKQIAEVYVEQSPQNSKKGVRNELVEQLKVNYDFDFLIRNFYIVDSTTSITKKMFPVKELLEMPLQLKKSDKPQILIYHTHGASESYADSRKNKKDSVIGTGELLARILREKYGYVVIHDQTEYDLIDGKIDRSLAYNKACQGVKKILRKNPSVKVILDLHRDGVSTNKRDTVTIQGKAMAKIMFFNGLSRGKKGVIQYLSNPYRKENLAFSLQLKCKAMEKYDGLTKPIYLKGYRYNLHMRKRSLLVELGNQNNLVQEIHNSVEPLADLLNQVLSE